MEVKKSEQNLSYNIDFVISIQNFKVTCNNTDFQCRYNRSHAKEKPKFLTLHSPFAFLSETNFKLNGHPEYFEIYFAWWNHQIRFKMVNFNMEKETAKSRVVKSQVCNLSWTTHSCPLIPNLILSRLSMLCIDIKIFMGKYSQLIRSNVKNRNIWLIPNI